MNPFIHDTLVAVGLFGILFVTLEAGFRFGRRSAVEADASAASPVGAIQGAVLGMLGLLLAFSFAGAGTRFIERQDLIVDEANAIGTAYLRASLLEEPQRSRLQAALEKRYTGRLLEASRHLWEGLGEATRAEIAELHTELWNIAAEGVAARPAVTLAVLPPINEVIDLHATRIAAGSRHLPPLVMGLLIACSLVAVGVMGYGCGMGRNRRAPLTVTLATLIGTALWITIDLDRPRAGLMQLSDAPLAALVFKQHHE